MTKLYSKPAFCQIEADTVDQLELDPERYAQSEHLKTLRRSWNSNNTTDTGYSLDLAFLVDTRDI